MSNRRKLVLDINSTEFKAKAYDYLRSLPGGPIQEGLDVVLWDGDSSGKDLRGVELDEAIYKALSKKKERK